ncbi:hypothetical protein TNCV_604091 [Trichonephila clavipes]|nr:hypothetical protein TNCV_604091 [Trichonephila clavipes]
MHVVSHSFVHHSSDSTILLDSTIILRKNILGVVRGFLHLVPFHLAHERTCDSTAIQSTPMPQRPIYLEACMPSSGFKPRPYGTAVSVTNHETGWVALCDISDEFQMTAEAEGS